jgi:hypothetical protein
VSSQTFTPEPLECALFLVVALSIAGFVHSAWLRCPCSRPFARPIDLGRTFRGRRIFGANKMWRGLMVMPIAAAGAFAGLAYFRDELPSWLARGMWPLPPTSFALLGLVSGVAFMLAELPNSFLKRQLDVAPGQAPTRLPLAAMCFVLDRVDSTIGVLLVLTLLVPVAPRTWLWALLIGVVAHGLFSMLLHALRIKTRPL